MSVYDLRPSRLRGLLSQSYLLGSGGTLMFDVTIVSQSFLYRKPVDKEKSGWRSSRTGRGTSAEEEGLLTAGTTGTGESAPPQHRRRALSNTSEDV